MELADNLHGKVINVGNASQGRLNPFQIITALEDDEAGDVGTGGSFATHLQFLEEFFKQILPDIDKESLEYLNSLVERTYANKGIISETPLANLTPEDYPVFDDLYDVVLAEFQRTDNSYLRSMLQTLINHVSKFSTGGRNSNIWNGPSTISTEENFTVFNFQSLLANRNQTIANAQMLLVLKYIDNEIIKNRDFNRKYGLNRKIIVVIDEAHVFIDTRFPIALDFMFQLAKRIRKYNGMQIVITQNIKDFVGSEEIARKSTAIINACQYSFIFGLAPNDMDDLVKLYDKAGGINEVEQEQILTAPRGHAFTIMSPTSRSFFKVAVPDTLVQMFEQPGYVSRYFTGNGGAENWEDYIQDSRVAHEQNTREKELARSVEEIIEAEKRSSLSFEEITVEEADKLMAPEPATTNVPRALEDIAAVKVEEEELPEISIPDEIPAPVQPVSVTEGIPLNIADIVELIRAEVRREFETELAKRQETEVPEVEKVELEPVPVVVLESEVEPEPEYEPEPELEYEPESEPEYESEFTDESEL